MMFMLMSFQCALGCLQNLYHSQYPLMVSLIQLHSWKFQNFYFVLKFQILLEFERNKRQTCSPILNNYSAGSMLKKNHAYNIMSYSCVYSYVTELRPGHIVSIAASIFLFLVMIGYLILFFFTKADCKNLKDLYSQLS